GDDDSNDGADGEDQGNDDGKDGSYFFPAQPTLPPDVCLACSTTSFRVLPKYHVPREAFPEYDIHKHLLPISLCSMTYLIIPFYLFI
ncbi:hypothetical protein ACQP3J_32260, partial [Escherichia coli]